MKFGQISNPETVDFSLQPYSKKNLIHIDTTGHNADDFLSIYLGGTSWINNDWKGSVYPSRMKPTDSLIYYGNQFNAIELNTTHYRIPSSAQIEKWISKVPEDFRFCPKFPQSISHRKDLGEQNGIFNQFINTLPIFKPFLGCTFIQFPTYFDERHIPLIKMLLERLPRDYEFAIELRGAVFYQSPLSDMLFEQLVDNGISLIVTDTAGRRDIVHNIITCPYLFIRFVACGINEIDCQRLKDWVDRMHVLKNNGVNTIYIFFHEPDHYKQADMAIYLQQLLKDSKDIRFRGPDLNKYNGQTKLF